MEPYAAPLPTANNQYLMHVSTSQDQRRNNRHHLFGSRNKRRIRAISTTWRHWSHGRKFGRKVLNPTSGMHCSSAASSLEDGVLQGTSWRMDTKAMTDDTILIIVSEASDFASANNDTTTGKIIHSCCRRVLSNCGGRQ